MSTYLRVTPALRDVLVCLLDATEEEIWGLRVSAATGRPTGTVYPLLERLERARFVSSRWETDTDRAPSAAVCRDRGRAHVDGFEGAALDINEIKG